MNARFLMGIALGTIPMVGCMTSSESVETGKAALSPQICETRAQTAYDACVLSCDGRLDDADGTKAACLEDANSDFGEYLGGIVTLANNANLGPVGDEIQACFDSVEFMDCSTIRDQVHTYVEQNGGGWDEDKLAGWLELGCNLDNFTRNWGYVLCVTDHAGEIATELGDGAVLGWELNRLPLETAQWAGWLGLCELQRGIADVDHWGCVGQVVGPVATGCESERATEYANCRGECLGSAGAACVPGGYPSWVECGVWVERPAWDALGGSCDCISDIFATAECAAYDWESGIFGSRTLNTPCRTTSNQAGRMTFVVKKNATGAPSGHEITCIAVDQYGVPQVPGLSAAQNVAADDSCQWALDGVCDEPRFCGFGTDYSDCNASSMGY